MEQESAKLESRSEDEDEDEEMGDEDDYDSDALDYEQGEEDSEPVTGVNCNSYSTDQKVDVSRQEVRLDGDFLFWVEAYPDVPRRWGEEIEGI